MSSVRQEHQHAAAPERRSRPRTRGTSGNVQATFICITTLVKFEQSLVHPAGANVKKLARPRNECNANLVSFCRANRKRSQKSRSQAIIQMWQSGARHREVGDTEVGKGRWPCTGLRTGWPRAGDGVPQRGRAALCLKQSTEPHAASVLDQMWNCGWRNLAWLTGESSTVASKLNNKSKYVD